METPEIDTYTYGPWIYIKDAKTIIHGNDDLFKWCCEIEYPYVKIK
jgi:hypothetical protein